MKSLSDAISCFRSATLVTRSTDHATSTGLGRSSTLKQVLNPSVLRNWGMVHSRLLNSIFRENDSNAIVDVTISSKKFWPILPHLGAYSLIPT
jgi:hypothetical protein